MNNESNKIHFNWITIQNFLSIGAEISIDFNELKGMNYVYGWNKDLNIGNGSGKSSIFTDSILWVLFNKTSKNVKVGNIPHRLHPKDCLVKINFNINGNNYEIHRGMNPNYVKLIKNGDSDLTESSIKETYLFIESEIIKSSFLIFKNSLVLSINDTKNIFTMAKWEKRAFVEQLLNFTIYGEMFDKVKDDYNLKDRRLGEERIQYNSLKGDIENFKNKIETFDEEQHEKIKNLKEKIFELNEKIKTNKTQLKDYEPVIQKIAEKLALTNDNLSEFNNDINSIKNNITNLKTLNKQRQHHVKKYENIVSNICKECNMKIESIIEFHKTENLINESICLIETKEQELEELYLKKDKLKKVIEKLKETHQEVKDKKQENILKTNELKYLNEKVDELNISLETIINEKSPFEDLIESYEKKWETSKEFLETLGEELKYLEFLKYALSEKGIKKFLLTDIINLLNNRVRKYLEEMGCEYTAIFDSDFNCSFITTSGPCEYDSFSSGEKRRIDLASMFAFRDLLFGQGTLQSNILMCDEILDVSIDTFAVENIIKILKEIAETQNIFIISHRECITPDDFNSIIKVIKENNYTRIIEDDDD